MRFQWQRGKTVKSTEAISAVTGRLQNTGISVMPVESIWGNRFCVENRTRREPIISWYVSGSGIPKGRYCLLCEVRKKKQFPGLWEGLGGSAQAGETSLESIVREVKEEIGLDFPPECFVLLKRSLEKTALVDIYELKADFAVEDLKLQTEEVDQAIWATEEELQQIISEGKFSAAALRRWEAVERAD